MKALCVPVNSATPERSFNGMNRIESILRASMEQDRMSSLAILSMEKNFVVDIECVLRKFCNSKDRRIELR